MYRRILFEEGLPRELVVVGVKLVAVVLVLWCCLQILPDVAKEKSLRTSSVPHPRRTRPKKSLDAALTLCFALVPLLRRIILKRDWFGRGRLGLY